MSGSDQFLDAEAIRAATFVRHVELHESLPSTNDRALKLSASPDLETPALVAARLQTAGRGRGTNAWWSSEGALTFSVLLDTAQWGITQRDWPRLSLTTGVAVCDAIESTAPCSIKWPNDVLVDGRKVCGILIESAAARSGGGKPLVIGVGINVNNSFHSAPSDVAANSIALCDVADRVLPQQELLIAFLQAVSMRLQQLKNGDDALVRAWQERSLLMNRAVTVTNPGRSLSGRCLGIADDGALLVETGGTIERVFSGSVEMR